MHRHAVLKLEQYSCTLHCSFHVQLMVTRSEVVSELEKQGVDVADMEGQLCSMARDVVHAAQAQVINLAYFHLCIFRASSGTAWCALSRCTARDGLSFLADIASHKIGACLPDWEVAAQQGGVWIGCHAGPWTEWKMQPPAVGSQLLPRPHIAVEEWE